MSRRASTQREASDGRIRGIPVSPIAERPEPRFTHLLHRAGFPGSVKCSRCFTIQPQPAALHQDSRGFLWPVKRRPAMLCSNPAPYNKFSPARAVEGLRLRGCRMTEQCSSSDDTGSATLAGLNVSGSREQLASPRPIRSMATEFGCGRAFAVRLCWRERGRTVAGAARSAATALDRLAKLRFAPCSRTPLSSRFR